MSVGFRCGDRFANVIRILLAGRSRVPVRSPKDVRHCHLVYVGWRTRAAGSVELVRADVDERRGVSVIRSFDHDGIGVSGRDARHAERQVVCFAPRAHQVAHAEGIGQRAGESLRVFDQVIVQVARVRIEETDLFARGFDHRWMAVTHVTHVVDGIEVLPIFVVVQVLHRSPDDLERLMVGEAQRRTDVPSARVE